MSLIAGSKLGPYEILAPIGKGGMGQVYRARDTRLHRDVAIKILQEAFAADAARVRFQREAHAASALNHTNICSVHDVGEADGRPYLVMELLDGQTLRDYTAGQRVDPAVAVKLGEQIVDALEAAHAKGIIHRDIKAANIMVTGRHHVKVLDFGLAKYVAAGDSDDTRTLDSLTAAGTVVGTPHYMAPEVLHGKPADARSDLWALGIVLHEMLGGRLPFQGPTAFEVSAAILREPAPPLPASVPYALRRIVERCLQKRPEDRYQSASELRVALEGMRTAAVVASASPARKRWSWVALSAAILIGGAALLWQKQLEQQRERQQQQGEHQTRTDVRTLTSGGTPSAIREANEAFELAMVQMTQGNGPRVQELLQRAINLDSRFTEGYRFLAVFYMVQILAGDSNDAAQLYKADEALRRVTQEAPRTAFHAELAGVGFMLGDKQRALAEVNRALTKDPLSREGRGWRLVLHFMAGENSAAKAIALNILERDPLYAPARIILCEILLTEGDTASALHHAQVLAEQGPNTTGTLGSLTGVYLATGEFGKVRELLEEKRAMLSNNYVWRLTWALLLALKNQRGDVLPALDAETLKWADVNFMQTLHAAEVYALLGDTSKAIDWLGRAVRNGDERVDWFRRNPRLVSLRADPRFQRIIASVQARRQQQLGK